MLGFVVGWGWGVGWGGWVEMPQSDEHRTRLWHRAANARYGFLLLQSALVVGPVRQREHSVGNQRSCIRIASSRPNRDLWGGVGGGAGWDGVGPGFGVGMMRWCDEEQRRASPGGGRSAVCWLLVL